MDSYNIFPKRGKIALGDVGMSSAISKNDYEVFLSFRGPDTRQGFTDCLYHALIDSGIVVFRDDDELRPGDKIDEILTALNNSKICIVVLSPTFAESAWCLREVERMVGMKKDIVPIFYHVSPDDVKLKTELYANSLTMHETKYGKEQVRKWRDALKEIPTIKGRELKTTGFVEFIRQMAKEMLMKLKVKHNYEIENFVEVPDEVEAALKLLDIGSAGCIFLAIHGMGGTGKTTLAKIIFNQISDNFDCSCFLENISENLSQGGLHKLQEQLLRSLDPSLRDATQIFDATGKIKNNFTRKKVIIVLDDIGHKNHIRDLVGSFGSGSRIIFTTRNAELHEQATSSNAHFYGLEKKEMDSKQALKLFSKHAFGEDSPPKDFEDLSAEVISTTGGLPLALEVVGSLLHRRNAKVWREKINQLKEMPHQDVQRTLKISYDALDAEQQEIFLDIACFFIGEEKTNAVYMWEACKFDPNYGIEVLTSMSLIKLNEKKCFWMHDQLRDLGRAIVKVNSKDAKAGSRLWMHKDALDLLKRNVGKEKVEALNLDGPSGYLDRKNFVGLEKLRFLKLTRYANFGGDIGRLIPKLRWLSLSLRDASDFDVSNLCLRELVVLELSYIRFDETWPGWGQILISAQLKVLTLSDCHQLISMPDLSKIVNLEKLVIQRCDKLISIHSSVGKLEYLRRFSITECYSLHKLPEELTSLESLKQIVFSNIFLHFNVQESIGRLVSLTRLELQGVANLPKSIGELIKLKHLSLRNCEELRVLPDSIGDLRLLVSLELWAVGITELPTTIGRLSKLESLCLCWCTRLQRLPDSVRNLHSLVDVDMQGASVVEFPDSFRGLEELKRLNITMERPSIRELHELPNELTWLKVDRVHRIHNLSNLIHLSQLEISNAILVVLEGIDKLSKLKRLSLESLYIKSVSMEWGSLQQLKSLELCCPSLEFGQCSLPSGLESLNLSIKKWGQLPINISSLKNLSKLKLYNFVIEEANWLEGLESLEALEMKSCILKFNDIPVVKRLRNLHLSKCRSHKTAHVLQIKLSNLKNLSKLELADFWIQEEGFNILGADQGLESLAKLKMSRCIIVEFVNASALGSLRSLYLERCSFPTKTCLDISQLDCLVELYIKNCNLSYIQGSKKFNSLTKLLICRGLKTYSRE